MTKTDTDLDARLRAKRAERFGAAQAGKAPQAAPAKGKPKGGRWQTYNGFMDVIAPHLSLAERAVWQAMFRHTMNGVCQTTERQIAEAQNVSRSTVEAALKRLRAAGLIWPIWLSRSKGAGSKWGLHARPWECREKLVNDHQPARPSGRLPR